MALLVKSGIDDLLPMVRSEGRHVSAGIRRMCLALGHYEDTPLPDDRSLLETGNAFEDLLIQAFIDRVAKSQPDRYIRPGEQCLDGVYGTPDLFDLYEHEVVEVKYTQLSVKNDPEGKKFWKYWMQLKAYCKMMGTLRGRLAIMHGVDWNFGRIDCPHCEKPVNRSHYHEWRPDGGQFMESEVEDAWRAVKAHS